MMKRSKNAAGVVLIEATIGVLMLLMAALAAIQLILVMHGALSARAAAAHAARAYALTGSSVRARQAFEHQKGLSMGALTWEPVVLTKASSWAGAAVTVRVPPVVPGAGVFGGGGIGGPIYITETGEYPIGRR